LIAVRFLTRAEWEEELRYYGCRPLEGKGKLNTAEWWRMPWQSYPFTVPVEADGKMRMADMDALRLLIVSSAPEGTTFPYE
jgi:hypothetical protein